MPRLDASTAGWDGSCPSPGRPRHPFASTSTALLPRASRRDWPGLLTRGGDESHRQKVRYSLTEAAIQLVPVMVALGGWGSRHRPADPELAARSAFLERGGQPLWDRLMAELRESHLDVPRPNGSGSVLAESMDRGGGGRVSNPPATRHAAH